MIVLESDIEENKVSARIAKASVIDEYYAMVDSGTNAIIVPLHPVVRSLSARSPAIVEGLVVQVLKHGRERRLVVALPQSAILTSQEWLTTVAGWTLIAAPRDGVSGILAYTPENPMLREGVALL